MRGCDEIGAQVHLLEAAYYIRRAKVQPFAKCESQNFVADQDRAKDIGRYGAGANYYVRGQNLKWTMQYLKALPRNSPLKPSNELSMQLQLFYY